MHRRPEEKNLWLGRTYTDAPDVDGTAWLKGANFKPGDLVACEIVGAHDHDLIARPVAAAGTAKTPQSPPSAAPQAAVVAGDSR